MPRPPTPNSPSRSVARQSVDAARGISAGVMATAVRGRSSLRATRITQQVLVAAGHPEPERVRRRLHDALQSHLADALTARFAEAARSSDETVWRIRRLELDLVVNTSWDESDLADAWAAECRRAVTHAIEAGGDGVTVMRFASPAAFLASFLVDVANGSCWTKWWYTEFDGMRLLTRAATIRTALLRKPLVGLQALATLSSPAAALVISEVTRQDARLLVDALGPLLEGRDNTDDGLTMLEVAQRGALPVHRDDEDRWVLGVLAEVARMPVARRSHTVVALAGAMARLASLTAEGSARLVVIAHAIRLGDEGALRTVAGGDDGARVAPLLALPVAVRAELVTMIAERDVADAIKRRAAPPEFEWMPVAAPLLLAECVAALPFGEASLGMPDIGANDDRSSQQASAAALLRLCVMATACGGERAARVLNDPVVRKLAGVGADIPVSALVQWLSERTPSDAQQLEHVCAQWFLSRGWIGAVDWLLVETKTRDEQHVTVLLDATRGHWLAIRDASNADGVAHMLPWLNGTLLDRMPARVLCSSEDQRAALLRAMLPLAAEMLPDAGPDVSTDVSQVLLRLDRLTDELAWITLPPSLRVPAAMERALQVAAQGILRSMAWRLPGFARATLPHLWTNFLAIDAQVVTEEHRVVATLSRPPLAMIVSMTGLFHLRYTLPWMTPAAVMLFPAERA